MFTAWLSPKSPPEYFDHDRASSSPSPLTCPSTSDHCRDLTAFLSTHHAYTSRTESSLDKKADAADKSENSSNAEAAKPLAPPPKPGQQQSNNTPDYFAAQGGGSLSLEPNPFEQSFGGGSGPETPGGTKLPSVAALTSPSSLLPAGNSTPFNWGGGSLRTGPLSPAMLSGPANDYFSDSHHLRGGFPTPNESSLRSGLTPGGSGSMFPAPSPNSQALYAQLASGGATPSTLDFHRTAMSAAAKRDPNQNQNTSSTSQPQQAATSQPQDMNNDGTATVKAGPKPATGPFDPHDNDAANGLFMLAQGAQTRNGAAAQQAASHAHPAPAPAKGTEAPSQVPVTKGVARGASEGSNGSDESEQMRHVAKGKGKKGTTNGRRKAEEAPAQPPPSKRAKANSIPQEPSDEDEDDDDDDERAEDGSKIKMTDEEKRKNFLERNRYVKQSQPLTHRAQPSSNRSFLQCCCTKVPSTQKAVACQLAKQSGIV